MKSVVLVQCQTASDRTRTQSRFPVFVNSGDLAGQLSVLIALLGVHVIANLVDEAHDLV